ncbi:16S rRNA (uracil(1498)-N(3))-methyltransferase [Sphingobacterium puteale]|uniref:Ribosomal RNA small subunit methyltransferase E n=1 Tax=Sphingobacterium puteale TaxID=2420510 RepID=A0A420W1B7_9SPHI|nr:16S rRNA (uracil(1498)-N(3))-methyltransferase [Sphingobacterium puteale]RKO72372.1 16S rRNA (uracil(1498)-N(3))-methyltransferase [Sphingobacterium puteale]
MQLFFTPELNPSLQNFILSEEESKHAVRVLRMNAGDRLNLIDGRGGLYEAEIMDPHPKRTVLAILDITENYQKPNYHLHIAVGPTKNIDRIEWFLEKATEVGIQEITPIICEHSERKEVKLDRLNKVIVSAMKQSLKAYLPKLNPATPFKQFLKDLPKEGAQKAIAHCVDSDKKYLNEVFEAGQHYIILIGPEGDFSAEEIDMALAAGFHPVSLGEARLRTETAALAACLETSLLNR